MRCGAALAMLSALSGCIVAVAAAVPALTAVGIVTHNLRVRAATPRPAVTVEANPAAPAFSGVTLTTLTELPPPSGAAAPMTDAWRNFLTFAGDRATLLGTDAPAQSALLSDDGARSALPRRRSCPKRTPAVLIDLDAGDGEFAAAPGTAPPETLPAELARLRAAGVVVMWISRAPAARVGEIGVALRNAGLDPEGRDPLLLVRRPEERKQVLREEANRDVCVVAIAGDERSDFDELFDYLRNPQDATMLDAMLGTGWFIVPPPLAQRGG